MRGVSTVLFLMFGAGLGASRGQMTVVDAASFNPGQPLAPGSFAAVFGPNLCGQTMVASWIAPGVLPTDLGGCSVEVAGMPAMLQYASPGQINIIVPAGLMPGMASVSVHNGGQTFSGTVQIAAGAPGMFSMNGLGLGDGAILHGSLWRSGPFSVTTGGQPTALSLFVTGLDPLHTPQVMIGGIPAPVLWFGNAPGYAGLQQINISLLPGMAGAGEAPVTITSGGVTSNMTFLGLLPTDSMMQGMPGWGAGMMVSENMPRAHEMGGLAYNAVNHTALIADRNDDVVRVISLDSQATLATITLPAGSLAGEMAVSADGTLAAAALSARAAVALLDLTQNQVVAVIGTGYFPTSVAFAGTTLLVSNGGSETVSVIDTATRAIIQTVPVAFGPSGLAVGGGVALVAGMQSGLLSIIKLADYSVSTITLPAGARPQQVAVSTQANKAVITNPMSNGVLILDLASHQLTPVDLGVWNSMGPGAVATNGTRAYVASQMTASVAVVDLNAGTVLKTLAVDPGPRGLAVDAARGQLLVLAEGTGTLDVVDLSSFAITSRMNGGETERPWTWALPLISSINPTTAPLGSSFTLTITGSNLQTVRGIEFHFAGTQGGMGGGMMGSGGMGMGQEDRNIQVSKVQVNAAGTQVTASVQILNTAAVGTHQLRLETAQSEVMGMMFNSLFTVTK